MHLIIGQPVLEAGFLLICTSLNALKAKPEYFNFWITRRPAPCAARAQLETEQGKLSRKTEHAAALERELHTLQAAHAQQAAELQQCLQDLTAAKESMISWQNDCKAAQVRLTPA